MVKGGWQDQHVGQSSLTLAQMDKRTTLLDADFGMANAHILLGVKPDYFISDALKGNVSISQTLCSDQKA